MNTHPDKALEKQIYYRLIALWVICEAFAGGLMHGIKLPFTGLIISSLAITCIILIAYHVPSTTAILRATITVAIFKLMLSPHSPPTAYIAVFFQGITGQLLFARKRLFTLSAVLLAVLGLVESAVQRIIVLVIVYGNDFWNAVNQYIQKLTGDKNITNYSLTIAVIYITIHGCMGVFIGIYAARLAKKSSLWKTQHPGLIITAQADDIPPGTEKNNRKKKMKWIFFFCWAFLLAAWLQSWISPTNSILTSNEAAAIITRSLLILLTWFLIISPLLMAALRKLLLNQRLKKKEEVFEVMKLIPQARFIFKRSWQMTSEEEGFEKVKLFVKILLINTI